ncbi:MAG: amidohydrolase family protein [Ignavibacteriales bacterium]|nr:amidohydrolase family protein [Ignavibacteriales bacterium]
MNKKILIPKQIICVDADERILRDHYIEITDGVISAVEPRSKNNFDLFNGEIIYLDNLTVIPGFVQTHIHLCQSLFRGFADDIQLLDWLGKRIFPLENAHNKNSIKVSAQIGLNELQRGGTTTLLDMGSLRFEEFIFEELINSKQRAYAGNCLMDVNDIYPQFKSGTFDQLKMTGDLAKQFHNSQNGKIKFAFSPRFVLSCSNELMIESKQMMKDFPGSLYHTHSSENKNEIEEVRKRFGVENILHFNNLDLLDDHTVLAHCVHTNEQEIEKLKKTNTRIAHCPSANLKLASGIADIPKYLKEGISVSLGADGAACNNSLSAFTEMRLASLIQKPIHGADSMSAKTVFKLATIEGAKALHLEKEIGSIEVGKKADLVFLNLESPFHPLTDNDDDLYSSIVYSSGKEDVINVMIEGEWVVKDGASIQYDEYELYRKGKVEFEELVKRAKL